MAAAGGNQPEDLDARVDALLRDMDGAYGLVSARLDGKAGNDQDDLADLAAFEARAEAAAAGSDGGGNDDALEASLDGALADAAAAADLGPVEADGVAASASESPAESGLESVSESGPASSASEAVVAGVPLPGGAEVSEGGGGVVGASVAPDGALVDGGELADVGDGDDVGAAKGPVVTDALVAMPTADVVRESPHVAPGRSLPEASSAQIRALDDQLASAMGAADEDEFADASSVLADGAELSAGALSPSAGVGALRAGAADAGASAGFGSGGVQGSSEHGVDAPRAAALAAVAGVPVVAAMSRSAEPARAVAAPARASSPGSAAVVAAVAKPSGAAGPSGADVFWRVVTPVIEPIAMQLGRLPVKTQQTFGWIGMVTLFTATMTWAYVFFFMPSKPASHVAMERAEARAAEGERGSSGSHVRSVSKPAPAKSASGGH